MSTKKSNAKPNIYAVTVLAILLLGILTFSIALGFSSCNHSQNDSSMDDTASDSSATEESSQSADSSQEDSSLDESSQNTISIIDDSEPEVSSDLPVIIEGQLSSTMAYEESIGIRYQIDMNLYEKYVSPEDPMEYVFLVNPSHTLSSDYVPDDLVDSVYTRKDGRKTQQLRLYAEMALEALMEEAALNGVTNVTITSAYRSYSYQDYLFNLYCEQNQSKFSTRAECEAYVLTFSTKPGTSEHQSGLCCDMHNLSSAEQAFGKTQEAIWLAENCWRFGFILRYPEDKEDITKIIWEPWHFRYVGRVASTEMHNLGMCLEEYCEYKGIGGISE